MAKKRMNFRTDDGRSCQGCSDGSSVTSWLDLGGTYSGPVKYWNEPIQGIADDCFFIAALKAVAYRAHGQLSTNSTSYTFYNPKTDKDEIQTLKADERGNDKKIAIFNTKDYPVYARCSTAYRWPLWYEKAYAIWYDKTQLNDRHWDLVDANQPGINAILNGGNGVTAMMHISRYRKKAEKGGILWDGNIPRYPTIAATANPKHTYMVEVKDTANYYLRNPCNNMQVKILKADLNTTNFDTWGYVYP